MQYFKHMTNMRNDIRIKRLISKYGLEGYGLYNLILESITESLTTDSPIPDLQETCEDIAEFYNGNAAKINEIAAFMINQGLIEVDEISARITCNKIYKYLEQSMTRSEAIRKMINAYKKGENQGVIECNDLSQTLHDKSDRIEEKRIEEKRKEKKITEKSQCYLDIEKKFLSYYEKMIGHQYIADRRLYDSQLKRLSKKIETIPNYLSLIDKKLTDMYNMSIKSSYWNLDLYAFCDRFDKIVDNSQKTKPTEINNIFAK